MTKHILTRLSPTVRDVAISEKMARSYEEQAKSKVGKYQVNLQKTPLKPSLPSNFHLFVKAGLPFLLFSVGASLVLKNALEGKNHEREKSKGLGSRSERQARLDAERDEMMEKLNKTLKKDFNNTKRIERPEEILERRKKEREERNRLYKRSLRWLMGQQ